MSSSRHVTVWGECKVSQRSQRNGETLARSQEWAAANRDWKKVTMVEPSESHVLPGLWWYRSIAAQCFSFSGLKTVHPLDTAQLCKASVIPSRTSGISFLWCCRNVDVTGTAQGAFGPR